MAGTPRARAGECVLGPAAQVSGGHDLHLPIAPPWLPQSLSPSEKQQTWGYSGSLNPVGPDPKMCPKPLLGCC